MIALRPVGGSRSRARVVLVCLPYAGGGGTVFDDWRPALPDDVELRAAVLPGRDGLRRLPPLERLEDYVHSLDRALREEVAGRDYVLFGHSLGAQAAYELTWFRRQVGQPLPALLVLAGREPSWAPARRRSLAGLPSSALVRALDRLDGTSAELLGNAELMELMLPMLRADFRMSENHRPSRREPRQRLPVPVLAMAGARDPEVRATSIARWARATDASFRVVVLPGGHFFLRSRRDQLIAELMRELDMVLPSGAAPRADPVGPSDGRASQHPPSYSHRLGGTLDPEG